MSCHRRSSETLVTLAEIEAAAARIRPAARVTPLIEVPFPPRSAGNGTACCSSSARTCSRWARSRFAAPTTWWRSSRPTSGARGVITYSSGNHGQAVALAARELGAPAVIVMPTTAPKVKVDGARGYGAEVIVRRHDVARSQRRAEEIAAERNLVIVPPFDHPMIIAGQGTAGLEILDQCPDVGDRARRSRRRRAELRRVGRDQAARAARARDRRRARGRREDEALARGRPARHARQAPAASPTA